MKCKRKKRDALHLNPTFLDAQYVLRVRPRICDGSPDAIASLPSPVTIMWMSQLLDYLYHDCTPLRLVALMAQDALDRYWTVENESSLPLQPDARGRAPVSADASLNIDIALTIL